MLHNKLTIGIGKLEKLDLETLGSTLAHLGKQEWESYPSYQKKLKAKHTYLSTCAVYIYIPLPFSIPLANYSYTHDHIHKLFSRLCKSKFHLVAEDLDKESLKSEAMFSSLDLKADKHSFQSFLIIHMDQSDNMK